MCLPTKTDEPFTSAASGTRSIIGLGALMLVACVAGPALIGARGGLGASVLLGAGGALAALALCAVVPVALVVLRRRTVRREPASGG